MKKLKFFISFVLFSFSLFSCGTIQAQLIERQERMFWELQTEKGCVYVLGTVHLGNDSLYPIEAPIMEAFAESETVYAEIAANEMEPLSAQLQIRIMEDSYFTTEEQRAYNYLSEAEIKQFEDMYGAYLQSKAHQLTVQNVNPESLKGALSLAKPWVIASVIDEILLEKYHYSSEFGIDMYFYSLAKIFDKEVKGLDDIKTQISLVTDMPFSYQLYSLKDTLEKLKTGEYEEYFQKLFTSYTSNDKAGLMLVHDWSFPEDDEKAYNEYRQKLLYDRNAKWVKEIKKLLQKGGKAFIYAGAAHFLGEKSVFDMLEKEGWLVLNQEK